MKFVFVPLNCMIQFVAISELRWQRSTTSASEKHVVPDSPPMMRRWLPGKSSPVEWCRRDQRRPWCLQQPAMWCWDHQLVGLSIKFLFQVMILRLFSADVGNSFQIYCESGLDTFVFFPLGSRTYNSSRCETPHLHDVATSPNTSECCNLQPHTGGLNSKVLFVVCRYSHCSASRITSIHPSSLMRLSGHCIHGSVHLHVVDMHLPKRLPNPVQRRTWSFQSTATVDRAGLYWPVMRKGQLWHDIISQSHGFWWVLSCSPESVERNEVSWVTSNSVISTETHLTLASVWGLIWQTSQVFFSQNIPTSWLHQVSLNFGSP